MIRVPLVDGGVREALLIQGPSGWGECSPLPGYPCPIEKARAAAHEAAFGTWPSPQRHHVPVNALIPAVAPDEAAERATVATTTQGYRSLKVKVGDEASVDRVAAVRSAVARDVSVRVDANGAWDPDEAVTAITRLVKLGVDLVEQPVATLEDLAAVRRKVAVLIAADECVRDIADARRLARLGAADVVVLKVQPLGGVQAALDVAEAAGIPAIVTSMLETSIGLAAGLALAAALPDLPYACGLGTAGLLAADVVSDPLTAKNGQLTVRRPTPSAELLERYRVAA